MKNVEKGQRIRIFIDESDTCEGKPLYEWIILKARELNLAGATVLRGILGYGASSHIHSARLLTISEDLPMIIEIVDTPEKIQSILPLLDDYVNEGLITLEDVKVLRYRHSSNK